MKKILSIIAATTAILTTCTSCGRTASMTKVEITKPMTYKQHTPDNEIIEGNQTAVQTISKIVDKEVSVGEDWPDGSGLGIYPVLTEDHEQYTCYEVEDFSKKDDMIIFLFKDDTEGLAATEQKDTFFNFDADLMDMSWKNFEAGISKSDYGFAYHNHEKSVAILSETVTSVWTYDSESANIQLIWADVYDCPLWKNYNT